MGGEVRLVHKAALKTSEADKAFYGLIKVFATCWQPCSCVAVENQPSELTSEQLQKARPQPPNTLQSLKLVC